MRGLNSLPIDDDIVDRILSFLPSYSSLGATILSSKSFYNIFKLHPNSILRAVSYNVTGPALPQSLRVLRYTPPVEHAFSQPDPLKTPPPPSWTETDPVSPITTQEARDLKKNAAVVNALEDLFSSRYKDRTSQTSKLDSMESWQFRRAMYRLILFSKAFPVEEIEDIDFDNDVDDEEIEHTRLKRKQLLSEFGNYDLLAIHSAAEFLMEIAQWAAIAENAGAAFVGMEEIAVCKGPEVVLNAYRTRSTFDLREYLDLEELLPLFEHYISHPLGKLWQERKMKPPPNDASHWKSILKDVHDKDACHRCGTVQGFNLWTEACWEYLAGVPSTRIGNLSSLLKGRIAQNLVDGPLLREMLSSSSFTYTKMLQEIHEIRTPPYDTWDKQDWLCEACITNILRSHLHLWLLERKRQNGQQIPEDCWYGYNCNTQVHKMHHVMRVNHLCEPTR
ncbi:hypothetical protein Hypma_000688 [Hypsizygus marmoreus]|uniref:Aprataxin and PNK-like factor PBZ domain-containing protein n=1 Tax=Hypsizygus marmoreus TaxID=39966 RepID=A0A369JDZ8_HYPMA|nr:hypothetical protein Hypma_000688 [Hypsizygus marmoreus]